MVKPSDILKDAIKAVPAVKYALGVTGIVAAIAIVASFQIDLRIALFGTIITLILMVILVLFANLSQKTTIFHRPAIVFTWFSLIMLMATTICLFTSVFFKLPLNLSDFFRPDPVIPEYQEKVVNIFERDWKELKSRFSNRDRSPGDIVYVQTHGITVADNFMAVPDNRLNLSRTIIKYQYAGYSYIMIAILEPIPNLKKKYARKAIFCCNKALTVFNTLKNNGENGNLNAQNQAQEFINDLTFERCKTILAWAYAILVDLKCEELSNVKQAIFDIHEKNPRYNYDYPPWTNEELIKVWPTLKDELENR